MESTMRDSLYSLPATPRYIGSNLNRTHRHLLVHLLMKSEERRRRSVVLLLLMLRLIVAQNRVDVEIDVNGQTITRDHWQLLQKKPPDYKEPPRSSRSQFGRAKGIEQTSRLSTNIYSSKKASKKTKSSRYGSIYSKFSKKGYGGWSDDFDGMDPEEECWDYFYKYEYVSVDAWRGKGSEGDDSSSFDGWRGKGTLQGSSKGYGKGKDSKKSSGSGDEFLKKTIVKEKIRCGSTSMPNEPSAPPAPFPTLDPAIGSSSPTPSVVGPTISLEPTVSTITLNPGGPTVSPKPNGPTTQSTRPTTSPVPIEPGTVNPASVQPSLTLNPANVPSSSEPSLTRNPSLSEPTVSPNPTAPTTSPMPSQRASEPTVSPNPTAPTTSPMPSQTATPDATQTTSPQPTALTASALPSAIPSNSSGTVDPTSISPSLIASVQPTTSVAPTLSRVPTLFPSSKPSEGPRCVTRANTFLCEQRFQQVKPPISEDCECYNFCDVEFVGCCNFDAFCKIDCSGVLVAGCVADGYSQNPTMAPNPLPPSTPLPTITPNPTAPTPMPSEAPTARCVVGTNLGFCPNVTATQEPVEGCDCYNYCNGRYNGCCGFGEITECQQDCVGVVVSGCELTSSANTTSSPAPTVTAKPSSSATPTVKPTTSPQPSASMQPSTKDSAQTGVNETIDADVAARSAPYSIAVPIYSLQLKLADPVYEMKRNDLIELSSVTSIYLLRHFKAAYSTSAYHMDDFSTDLLTHEKNTELSQVTMTLRSIALFDSALAPSENAVLGQLHNAFSGTKADGYLGMVQALPRHNIFSSTTDVRVIFESEENSDKPQNRTTAVVLASLASILAIGAAAGFSCRRYANCSRRSAELVKDEGTVSLTVSTVADGMSISILKAPEKRPLDFDLSNSPLFGRNWWEDDISYSFDPDDQLDEESRDKFEVTVGSHSAKSPIPRKAQTVAEKNGGRDTVSTYGHVLSTNPFDNISVEGNEQVEGVSKHFLASDTQPFRGDNKDYRLRKHDEGLRSPEISESLRGRSSWQTTSQMTSVRNPSIMDSLMKGGDGQSNHSFLGNHDSPLQRFMTSTELSTQTPPEDYLLSRLRAREYLDKLRPPDPPMYERVGETKRNVISRAAGREPSGSLRKDPST